MYVQRLVSFHDFMHVHCRHTAAWLLGTGVYRAAKKLAWAVITWSHINDIRRCAAVKITVVTNHPCYDTVTLNPNNKPNCTALHMSCCMLACRNYVVRVEHCLIRALPDRRADKKFDDWWLSYVLACDELTVWRDACVTRWSRDELTGSPGIYST